MLFSSRAKEKVDVRLFFSFSHTLEVFIRVQLSKSHTRKIERNPTELPRTASQEYWLCFSIQSLFHYFFPSLGPSLILSVIDMAMQGPLIKKLHLEWTANLVDPTVWGHIVFFTLLVIYSFSSLYLLIICIHPQISLLEYPRSFSVGCEPSQTHFHFYCSKYNPFWQLRLYPWSAAYSYL